MALILGATRYQEVFLISPIFTMAIRAEEVLQSNSTAKLYSTRSPALGSLPFMFVCHGSITLTQYLRMATFE